MFLAPPSHAPLRCRRPSSVLRRSLVPSKLFTSVGPRARVATSRNGRLDTSANYVWTLRAFECKDNVRYTYVRSKKVEELCNLDTPDVEFNLSNIMEAEGREEVTVGASDASDVVIAYGEVSKLHLKFYVRGPEKKSLFVEDMGSTHGTRVNEWILLPGQTVEVKPGETVELARTYRFQIQRNVIAHA